MHRIRLILLGLVLATLAVGCPHVSVVVPNAAPAQTLPPVPPRVLATGGADPFAWYANERAAKFFYVTDPTMAGVGAKGDNVTDDTAAIVAADAAAKAVLGTVVFPPPPFATRRPPRSGCTGRGTGRGSRRTLISPRSARTESGLPQRRRLPLDVRIARSATTPGPLDNAPSRALFEDMTIDCGSGAARTGILLDGSEYGRLRNVHVINCIEHGVRNASVILPPTISSTTQSGTGGSPTGITFTQADPNYLLGDLFVIDTSAATPTTIALKIVNPGALNTATFAVSFNGGAYSAATFPLEAVVQVATSGGAVVQANTGILAQFPAGSYNAGTIYTVTVTPTDADIGQAQAANDSVVFDQLSLSQDGTLYATAGLIGGYNGFTFTATASGTVATTSGSQIVEGSGTSFLTGLQGCNYGRAMLKVGGIFYEVGAILDDTHLALVESPVPSANASGLDYAISCNAGYYEDGANESDYTQMFAGEFGQDSICAMFGYQRGMMLDRPHFNSCAIAGAVFGGAVDQFISNFLVLGAHFASGTIGANHGIPLWISPHSNGDILDPLGLVVVGGNPVSWTIRTGGFDGPLSNNSAPLSNGGAFSYMPIEDLLLIPNIQTVTSNAFTVVLPDLAPLQQTGHSSLIDLRASPDFTDYVFTATPIIPNPSFAGLFLYIRNGSLASTYAFPNWLTSNSGIVGSGEYTTIGPQQTLVLMSTVQAAASPWVVVGVSKTYGNSNQNVASLGNTGETEMKKTTSNATPTTIIAHSCTTLASGAGGIDFDVMANSGAVNAGTNVGSWEHCFIGLDIACNITAYTCDIVTGTNIGLPPAGWAVTHSTSGTNPMLIQVTGDSSANPVRWVWRGSYREGANF